MFSEFSFLFSDICFAVCKVVGGVVIIKVGSINNRAISCTVHSADGSSYWKDRAPTLQTTSLLCFISQLLLLLRGISSTGLLFLTPALCFQCSNATNNNSMISTFHISKRTHIRDNIPALFYLTTLLLLERGEGNSFFLL